MYQIEGSRCSGLRPIHPPTPPLKAQSSSNNSNLSFSAERRLNDYDWVSTLRDEIVAKREALGFARSYRLDA
ncbi:hypothetical protein H2248_008974 [Termitomyces sp. 'cryptogamus']|nr:hypothetical protein H2248_008974 [Termitomyces sp. 'cryptogamus']